MIGNITEASIKAFQKEVDNQVFNIAEKHKISYMQLKRALMVHGQIRRSKNRW